ncbi:unnamed protein product [Thelazia callipaeda]|uniref:DFDF domain-containing protein n=1 Tax=Thelazia callipaeda TaxID=103827 RepID=A0A0N5CUV4_THECL|nr:unnamed protein product [Thelazia callipaeda]
MSTSGEVVALNMKDGTCIQGRIKSVDVNARTVWLQRPFQNGKPMGELEKSFSIDTIQSFRVLDVRAKRMEELEKEQRKEKKVEKNEKVKKVEKVGNGEKVKKEEKVVKDESKKKGIEKNEQRSHHNSPSGSSSSSYALRGKSKRGYCSQSSFSRHSSATFNSSSYTPGLSSRYGRNRGQSWFSELQPRDKIQSLRDKKSNEGLLKPIDFDLEEDFDFEKNLEIFRKYEENMEQKEASSSEAQYMHRNYEHYENVVSDPSRVNSWTMKEPVHFVAARLDQTINGQEIPFLAPSDKEKFLQKAEPYLGSDIFHVMVADRLMTFVWNVIDRFEIMVSQVVVLDSATVNTYLTAMFLRHISNRACQTVIYPCTLGPYDLPFVRQVRRIEELPKDNIQLIVVLCPSVLGPIRKWIRDLSPSPHLICIEKPPEIVVNEHTMMVGVGTDNNGSQKHNKNSNSVRAVVDIGIPFTWMDTDSASCLSRTFATQNIVIC